MTELFIASAIPHSFPNKLQKPSTVNRRVRDKTETFIMDSGIGDDTDNADVLDLAAEYNADYVVACDVLHDQQATTESVHEFLRLYDDHETDATPLIPLQPPHSEHYRDLPEFDHYCLGGMATEDVSDTQAIRWIRQFRDAAGPEPYVHALGVGGGIEFVRQVAGSGMVDSVDCSTPEMAAMFGKVLDAQLRQTEVRIGSGEGVSRRNIPLAEFNSWQIKDAWDREAERSTQTRLPIR